ncbi:MAG: YiiX/YebB-like N1pC/P60 family cysteine hydrolase [Treponema sp.]
MISGLYSQLAAAVTSGDIILRRGKGPVSSVIIWYLHDGSKSSHCALIVKKEDLAGAGCLFPKKRIGFGETIQDIDRENLLVVHSVAGCLSGVDGVQLETLRGFLQHSVPGTDAVYRPLMDESVRIKAVTAAASAVNRGVPFDYLYRSGIQNALYCSSFLVSIFRQAGWDGCSVIQTKHGIMKFSSFTDSHWYKPIYTDSLKNVNPAPL